MHYIECCSLVEPLTCGSADKKLNTTLIGNKTTIGAQIHYKCPTDYYLVGDEIRTCTEEGFWSGHASSCFCKYFTIKSPIVVNLYWFDDVYLATLDVDCGSLPSIENGDLTMLENRTTYGARAEFRCKSNYTLVGQSIRTCGKDGIWNGQQPQCLCT